MTENQERAMIRDAAVEEMRHLSELQMQHPNPITQQWGRMFRSFASWLESSEWDVSPMAPDPAGKVQIAEANLDALMEVAAVVVRCYNKQRVPEQAEATFATQAIVRVQLDGAEVYVVPDVPVEPFDDVPGHAGVDDGTDVSAAMPPPATDATFTEAGDPDHAPGEEAD